MAVVICESGAYRVKAKYLELRDNTWYFRRRIPADVRRHYPKKPTQIFVSLKTSDARQAAKLAHHKALEQDAFWGACRSGQPVVGRETRLAASTVLDAYGLKPGQHKEYERLGLEPDDFLNELRHQSQDDEGHIVLEALSPDYALATKLFYGEKVAPNLTDARDKHFALGLGARGEKSRQQFDNAFRLFLGIAGDLPVDQYRREHANAFVSALVERNAKCATIKRYVAQLSPVFATALREFEIQRQNVFSELVIPNKGDPVEERPPFSLTDIRNIQARCRQVDDQRRWAISMVSDTGARLSEILGLRPEDVVLETEMPHIVVQRHEGRRLKTAASERVIPLVGEALWAAGRAMTQASSSYLLPVFAKSGKLNAASASAALNKWLREQNLFEGKGKVIHSFRHSFRDRMRDVGTPPDVIDRIGGWSASGVGEGYGKGHSLSVMASWMAKGMGSYGAIETYDN
ncbi:MAG TPA: tyrosine-type recombinase/integrase [Albidovulum sp.]|uniref:DUF6538 domain-containing protein n=1 Tax=Albidovulum sp. TaxID=1872424 RepID=UPI002BAE4165|nr:tyrosine-type recombinase/integrase [Albidovulum sp.]